MKKGKAEAKAKEKVEEAEEAKEAEEVKRRKSTMSEDLAASQED